MFEALVSKDNISFIMVFVEGILSFFSPCVIPLIPVYMSYLSGNTEGVGADGRIAYNRKKVFLHTVCFVLGISFAFFILGMSFTAIGSFFKSNRLLFTRIAGIIIVILGLFQIGVFNINLLNRERKFYFDPGNKNVNPLIALVMGFTFSFAWTPCIGPMLSSVLILASSARSSLLGNMLVLLYAIGFIIPFLLLGLFTTQVLNFLRKYQKLVKYTVKTGGFILILMGIMTFTGWMNSISGYLNSLDPGNNIAQQQDTVNNDNTSSQTNTDANIDTNIDSNNDISANTNTNTDTNTDANTHTNTEIDEKTNDDETNNNENEPIPAFDFTLVDQYGNEHTLSNYKGKVVFLNFWATWCPPCRAEMPDIEEIYNEYNKNQDDVIILGIANPSSDKNQYYTQEVDKEGVISFLKENGFTFPVMFDETGEVFMQYYITAFPTTFLIDKNGNIYGYAPGKLTKDIMKNAIEQTLNSTN